MGSPFAFPPPTAPVPPPAPRPSAPKLPWIITATTIVVAAAVVTAVLLGSGKQSTATSTVPGGTESTDAPPVSADGSGVSVVQDDTNTFTVVLLDSFQTDTTPMSNDIGSFARVAGSSDPSTLDITVLVAKADTVPAPADLVHLFDPGADVCPDRSTQSGYETINGVAEVLLIDGCGAGGDDSNVVMAIDVPAQQSVILVAAKGPGPSNTDLLDFAQAVGESVVIL